MSMVSDFTSASLLAEIVPLYITGTIAFFIFMTFKRALVGKPRLILFRVS